jgi:hypothetical protein
MRFRSFIFVGFGLVALALAFIMPSTASSYRFDGVYASSTDLQPSHMLPDFAVAVDHVALHREGEKVIRDRATARSVLGPVYALSLQTDGHSLIDIRRRC